MRRQRGRHGIRHSAGGWRRFLDDFRHDEAARLGLGLAISKRIVEQLDGTITVASEVGRGTAFTLRFLLRRRNRRGGGKLIRRRAGRYTRGRSYVQDISEDGF